MGYNLGEPWRSRSEPPPPTTPRREPTGKPALPSKGSVPNKSVLCMASIALPDV